MPAQSFPAEGQYLAVLLTWGAGLACSMGMVPAWGMTGRHVESQLNASWLPGNMIGCSGPL